MDPLWGNTFRVYASSRFWFRPIIFTLNSSIMGPTKWTVMDLCKAHCSNFCLSRPHTVRINKWESGVCGRSILRNFNSLLNHNMSVLKLFSSRLVTVFGQHNSVENNIGRNRNICPTPSIYMYIFFFFAYDSVGPVTVIRLWSVTGHNPKINFRSLGQCLPSCRRNNGIKI